MVGAARTIRIVRQPSFQKESLQMRSLAFAVAIGAMALLPSGNAGALPGALVESAVAVESNLLLVRDGCGRGFRWSNRRQACVEDFQGPPPAVYIRPAPPPPVYIRPAPPPPVYRPACPPGMRFSNSRQACVWY
jgi:hypothetical protein